MTKQLAEIGIVHGAGMIMTDEGALPTRITASHALQAAKLLEQGYLERVICTGLGPLSDEVYLTSEARLMADILVRSGVSISRIEIEDTSTSTLGNHVLAVPIIQRLGAERVIGITSKSHQSRAMTLGVFVAQKAGHTLEGYVPVRIDRPLRQQAKDYTRESIMRAMSWVFVQLHYNTPLEELIPAYERFKEDWRLHGIKRHMHGQATDR